MEKRPDILLSKDDRKFLFDALKNEDVRNNLILPTESQMVQFFNSQDVYLIITSKDYFEGILIKKIARRFDYQIRENGNQITFSKKSSSRIPDLLRDTFLAPDIDTIRKTSSHLDCIFLFLFILVEMGIEERKRNYEVIKNEIFNSRKGKLLSFSRSRRTRMLGTTLERIDIRFRLTSLII